MRVVHLPLLAASAAVFSASTARADDGLKIEYTIPKSCNRPTQAGDDIIVHYRGTLQSDGSVFDESYKRGVPFSFRLGVGEVIKGWDEGLLAMCVGEQRKLVIPPELAYGHRNLGIIPPDSTLVFATELLEIVGVPPETEEPKPKPEEFLPPPPFPEEDDFPPPPYPEDDDFPPPPPPPPPVGSEKGPTSMIDTQNGECKLLGPFALIVQGALGALALLSLVFKRWRERPRRPVKIWFFDASKQVAGTFLLHLANLAMSMFSSGGFDISRKSPEEVAAAGVQADDGRMPNPCSFYLLNLAIDTTIGIPILVISLRVLYALFLKTPLANPPESIQSGYYGEPPRVTWWLKQSLIYFIGLFGMKLFVFLLFQMLPWLAWVGDWALRWTEGNEALQIAFVMFIFPVAMNAIQYYVIDSFIKKKDDKHGFQAVPTEEQDDEENGRDSVDIEDGGEQGDESKRRDKIKVSTTEHLAEANPTAVPNYESESDGEGSRPGSSAHRK